MSDTSDQPKTLEWITVTYTTAGRGAVVKVVRRRENMTASWSVRAASSAIAPAVRDARKHADNALAQVLEAAE